MFIFAQAALVLASPVAKPPTECYNCGNIIDARDVAIEDGNPWHGKRAEAVEEATYNVSPSMQDPFRYPTRHRSLTFP